MKKIIVAIIESKMIARPHIVKPEGTAPHKIIKIWTKKENPSKLF